MYHAAENIYTTEVAYKYNGWGTKPKDFCVTLIAEDVVSGWKITSQRLERRGYVREPEVYYATRWGDVARWMRGHLSNQVAANTILLELSLAQSTHWPVRNAQLEMPNYAS